jgi:histidyl-tRNA synthetase
LKKATSSSSKLQTISGAKDVITQTDPIWNLVLKSFYKIGRVYGFLRVETPILEDRQLYQNFAKDMTGPELETIAVQLGTHNYGVRPSLLPSILRAYAQKKVDELEPLSKWLYLGNVIKGSSDRGWTSDYEYGLETLGAFNHLTEAQTIAAAWQLVQDLGLVEATLEINTIGDASCQQAYESALKPYLKENEFSLCENCVEQLRSRPFNILRCDNESCQTVVAGAPTILDFLDETTHKHFTNILEALDELQIPYQLNPLFIGREGFSKTNVIIQYKNGKDTVVLGEAGYHDALLKNLGGKGLSGFGFTGSFLALKQAMELANIAPEQDIHTEVFLVPLGELAAKKSLRLFRDLIAEDVKVYDHFGAAGVKNQLKQAELCKSPIALIMGQKEAMDEMVILRDVKSGMQELFSYDKIVVEVKKRLGH